MPHGIDDFTIVLPELKRTGASIMKEMAKPRMAKSACEEAANRAAGRIMPVKRGKA